MTDFCALLSEFDLIRLNRKALEELIEDAGQGGGSLNEICDHRWRFPGMGGIPVIVKLFEPPNQNRCIASLCSVLVVSR